MLKVWLAMLLLMYSMVGQTKTPLVINVPAAQPQFVISLPANATTGYQWSLTKYDKNLLNLVKSQYVASKTRRMGAGGRMLFVFSKTKTFSGQTELSFTYARPWEKGTGTQQAVTVNFR